MPAATRKRSGTGRTTRRRRGRSELSVESLHASFKELDRRVRELLEKGCTDSEAGTCIQRVWGEQFGSPLTPTAVRGLVLHYRATFPVGRKTRKARKDSVQAQAGGSAQAGGMAPINWTMGQGVGTTVYGSFPVEMGASASVVKNLDLGRFYESPIGRSCDSTGGHAAQTGGSLWSSLSMGHAPTSVPPNTIQTVANTLYGSPTTFSSASPIAASVSLASAAPVAFDSSAISKIGSLAPVYSPMSGRA